MDEQRRVEEFRPRTEDTSAPAGADASATSGAGTGAGGDTSAGKVATDGNVSEELQELGRRLSAAARAAWESEQRQGLQQEIADGMRLLRDQLNDAVEGLRTHPRTRTMTQQMKDQVGKAAETTRVTEVIDDVRSGLASGLRDLNNQLDRLTTRLERREGTAARGDSATAGSAVSSVGGAQTNPSTSQMQHGEQAARSGVSESAPSGATAEELGAVLPTGEPAERPGLMDEQPIAGASQSDLAGLDRNRADSDMMRHPLPGSPEGPTNPPVR